MEVLRFIVTGTGHSGTGYIAQVLSRCGIRCGHESIYGPNQALGLAPAENKAGLMADSSWLALPVLPEGIPAFLQVRHPLRMAHSEMRSGTFSPAARPHSPYHKAKTHHIPTMRKLRSPDGAMEFWLRWNLWALDVCEDWWRVEDLAPGHLQQLGEVAGVKVTWEAAREAIASVATDYNHQKPKQHLRPLSWDDIRNPALRHAARGLAGMLGYA